MKTVVRAAAIAAALFVSIAGVARAQQPEAAPPQIALTDQQVQGFITATPEINAITEKLQAEPDKKTMAQLDALAKKGGFASFDDYEAVSTNISIVMQAIDPKTKKFGDPKIMIQAQ